MRRELYPAEWEAISRRVRERAGWRCEFCGAKHGEPHPLTGSRVILTVAHVLNDDPMDVRDENLKALCNRCHLLLDLPMHLEHAKQTRRRKKEAQLNEAGQLRLWDGRHDGGACPSTGDTGNACDEGMQRQMTDRGE